MHQAKTIRTIDAVASSKRMEELNLIEEVRKSNIREQEKRRKQRDRQLLIAAGVGLLLFILAIVFFSLLI
jgi:cell division septal protein FtsQ